MDDAAADECDPLDAEPLSTLRAAAALGPDDDGAAAASLRGPPQSRWFWRHFTLGGLLVALWALSLWWSYTSGRALSPGYRRHRGVQ